jgi:hypothetical protein
VEPVHYLLCEPGPDQGAVEHVRDIAAACPEPLHANAILAFAVAAAAGSAEPVATDPVASAAAALRGALPPAAGPPAPAAAAL